MNGCRRRRLSSILATAWTALGRGWAFLLGHGPQLPAKQSRRWTRWLREKRRAPHGSLLGVPQSPQVDEDGDVRPLDAFRSDLAQAKGRTLVVERAGDWGEQAPQGNPSRLEHLRYGLERAAIDPLRTATGRDVLGACGVPPTLLVAKFGWDSAARGIPAISYIHPCGHSHASWRAELRVKLDAPELVLDLSELHAQRTLAGERAPSRRSCPRACLRKMLRRIRA